MFTGNQNMTRTSFSFDAQRVTLAIPVEFLAPGSGSLGALLQQYSPPQGGVSPTNLNATPGVDVNAGPEGTEGVVAFYCNGVGDYTIVLQNSAQRMKRASLTLLDPENTTPGATSMRPLAGDIASGFPNMTSYYKHILASGIAANVTATAATQATVTIASAALVTNQWASTLGAQYIFTILTDSHTNSPNAGLSAIIQSNTNASNSVLTVAGLNAFQLVTEASSSDLTWQVTLNGTVIATSTNYTGNVAVAAYAPATWLDDAASWNTNQFLGQTLIDSIGNTYLIVSNTNNGGAGTATLTLADVDITQNPSYIDPTGGSYQIASRTEQGQPITVCTGTASSSSTLTFTPTFLSGDAMFAGQFSGMILTVYNTTVINAAGGTGSYDQWLITSNSTTVLTVVPVNVAPAASQTVPFAGAWTVTMTAGAASIEILLSASNTGSVSGLIAAGQSIAAGAGVTATATAALAAPVFFTVTVTAAASSVAVTGALVGQQVIAAFDNTTTKPTLVNGAYEGVISIAGHIQQTSASGANGITTSDSVTLILGPVPTVALAGAAHSSAVSGTATLTPTAANPGNGEVIVIELALSNSTQTS